MRDAIGQVFTLQIILAFVLLINGYMAYSVNYTRAFRVKNQIVNIIEQYEGPTKDEGMEKINDYINKKHRELGDTPNNVWHKGIENVKWRRLEEEKVEDAFMHEIKRKVSKDGVISINNELYEVDNVYREEDVNIRYYINNLDKMWIYEKDERKSEVRKLNKKENSKVKRENKIDYSKIVNNEEDVIELGDSDDVS